MSNPFNVDLRKLQRDIEGLFSWDNRRSRFTLHEEIHLDPASFLIGAIGAVTVGNLADESRDRRSFVRDHNDSAGNPTNTDLLIGTVLRAISSPVTSIVRFFAGGLIYIGIDTITTRVFNFRSPCICGAATAMCFANGSRPMMFVGSVIGVAIFAELADRVLDYIINQ